jgi:RNA polymerase sporulation-specific sigma factor
MSTALAERPRSAVAPLLPPDLLDDAALVGMAHGGDERALCALLDRYRPLVRSRCARYYLQGADRADVVQEGMIGLYKAVRDFDPALGHEFAAFATRCVERQVITAVRSAARSKHQPLTRAEPIETPAAAGAALTPAADDPEALAVAGLQGAAIGRWCAAHLSDVEREVLRHHLLDLSYVEIGVRTGLSAKGVDNAVQRIRRKLQRYLDQALVAD